MEAAMVEVSAGAARERLLAFVGEVVRPLPHVRQRENALVYVRGLVEQGGRKSLQPTLFRLQESPACYESLQQFLADSPWDPRLLIRACAERVAPQIGVVAWVVDDTGIAKDGAHSPGVKRQYSGSLGKIGNCQVAVSVHAVGERGTLPLGWSLYLPEDSTAPTARTPASGADWRSSSLSTCSPCGPGRASTARKRPLRYPSTRERPGFCVCMIRKGGSCPRRRSRTS